MGQRKRNSNLELLRIISMFMIVFIHANMYLPQFCEGNTRLFFNGVVNGICNIGVTCFILRSGYFGLNFNLRKLLKMECMMITLSFIETVILCLLMPQEMQGMVFIKQMIKSCFPVITRKYWFYSCYICLFCFSGYLNKFTELLDRKAYKKLLGILFLFFSILPTIFYFEIMQDHGKGLVQMVFIYILGRYLGKYEIKIANKKRGALLFLGLWILNGISHEFPVQLGGIYHHLCKDNSVTNIGMAVLLFLLVKEWSLGSSGMNRLAGSIFAIFALNNSVIRGVIFLLENTGKLPISGGNGFGILVILVIGVMIVCSVIGIVRELVFGRTERWVIDRICSGCEQGKEFYDKCKKKYL